MYLTASDDEQVTLPREVVAHLGVGPGERVAVDLLPGGIVRLRPRAGRSVSTIFGRLKREGEPPLTIEEIREVSENGWAGEE